MFFGALTPISSAGCMVEKLPINRPSGCYVMEDPTMEDPSLLSALGWVYGRSEGFPRTAYFVPGCDGMGVWPNSEIVLPAPPAPPSFIKKDLFLIF